MTCEVIVTFSGGVDSTFLLAVSHEALGAKRSHSPCRNFAGSEYANEELALEMGVTHYLLDSHELEQDGYRKNGADNAFIARLSCTRLLHRGRQN